MKFLVLDQGSFIEAANRLANKGSNDVFYFSNWQKAFPTYDSYAPGVNFEYLKKELYFFDKVESSDCIICFDVSGNDTIKFLRKIYPNKSIFGSGEAEKLEQNRWKLKKVINGLGLPLQKSWHIVGIDALSKFLKDHNNIYVKLNIFRGEQESFFAKNLDAVNEKLKVIDTKFACHEDQIEFICEEEIGKSVEFGVDAVFSGNEYSDKAFLGIEVEKFLYIAKVIDFNDLPKPLKNTMDKFKPVFRRMNFMGFFSTEEKIVSSDKSYFLDICSRMMLPGSVGYVEWINNFTDVVYQCGLGKKVKLDIPYKYVAAVALESQNALNEYLHIDIKKSDRDKVKFVSACCDKKGNYYTVKGMTTAAILISNGKSWQEAISNLKSYRDLVNIEGLNKSILNGIEQPLKEIIGDAKKYGIDF